jgi:hypothetical protein
MKIGVCFVAAAAALTGACATSEPYPNKRPLSQENIALLADTNFVVVENNNGVEASWFMQDSSAASAQYGLIGALVSAGMDAMMNAGPAGRAQQTADELATVALADKMNQSLRAQIEAIKAASPAAGVSVAEVTTTQKILSPNATNDAVELRVSYTLSEDASAMNIVATATYQRADVQYKTPYTFKSVPKSELEGPLYRNTFVYESNRFQLPALTPELKGEMVAAIQKKYAAKTGAIPVSASSKDTKRKSWSAPVKENKDYEEMSKEIKEANDNTLSKSEASAFLIREWLKSDGAFLLNELETAHAYIAKYLLLDLNSAAVPSMTGTDQMVEQVADGRTVRMIGAGPGAGSYVSSPGGLKDFTTFGNAIQIADTHRKRINDLQASAKKQNGKK